MSITELYGIKRLDRRWAVDELHARINGMIIGASVGGRA